MFEHRTLRPCYQTKLHTKRTIFSGVVKFFSRRISFRSPYLCIIQSFGLWLPSSSPRLKFLSLWCVLITGSISLTWRLRGSLNTYVTVIDNCFSTRRPINAWITRKQLPFALFGCCTYVNNSHPTKQVPFTFTLYKIGWGLHNSTHKL